MKRLFSASALALAVFGVAPAAADWRCTTPMAKWQPREALQEKMRAAGWTVRRIKTDDGCYKVYAVDENGRRIRAKFDPATLEMVRRERDEH